LFFLLAGRTGAFQDGLAIPENPIFITRMGFVNNLPHSGVWATECGKGPKQIMIMIAIASTRANRNTKYRRFGV
jgi:hypothetical protein